MMVCLIYPSARRLPLTVLWANKMELTFCVPCALLDRHHAIPAKFCVLIVAPKCRM